MFWPQPCQVLYCLRIVHLCTHASQSPNLHLQYRKPTPCPILVSQSTSMRVTFYLFFPAVLLLQLSFACSALAAANISNDQAALLALKSGITNDPHQILTNWSITSPTCSWFGITCGVRHYRVTALDLSHLGLQGTLSSQIGNLSFLAYLSLRNNSFFGSLPEELGHLRHLKILDLGFNFLNGSVPPTFGLFPKLQDLSLESNSLVGNFPTSSLLNLSSLLSINVSRNWLSGFIPSNTSSISSLQIIDLSVNNISDVISDELFSRVPRLQGLYLSWNQLYGEIPKSLFECRELQVVSLSNNKLTGSIPTEFGNLTMLKYLSLDHNNFSGELMGFGQLLSMEILSLSNNHFTGVIPRGITNSTLLKEINIGDNGFTGEIPPEFGDLSYLRFIRMSSNGLKGNIPSGLFNLSALETLFLHENQLSGNLPPTTGLFLTNLKEFVLQGNEMGGVIPKSICNTSKLTSLDLSHNLFTGSIPSAICDIGSLQRLNLGNNYLTSGSGFPSSLARCNKLSILVLSSNALNSTLPISFGNLSASLQQFWIDDCKIKGTIPQQIINLTSLISLHLENNGLSNIIPEMIGRLRKLQGLYLHNNNLEGSIVHGICLLDNLGELFLGGNKLSGAIPYCLGNLTTLRHVNLSSNRLTSNIPSTIWSLKDVLLINFSSNFITGSLPRNISNLKVVVEIDLSRNKLSGEIPVTIGDLVNLAYLSLAENIFEGEIPGSLGLSIEFLDLSFNNLSGIIPGSLEKLLYLKNFNVSFNRLEGKIPEEGPFKNFSAQSYMMNRALCGARWLQVRPCENEQRSKRIMLFLKMVLPMTVFVVLVSCLFVRMRRVKDSLQQTDDKVKVFTYRGLEEATKGWDSQNVVGIGSSSLVYVGVLDSTIIAIKVPTAEPSKPSGFNVHFDLFLNPDGRRLRHRNLIKIFGRIQRRNFSALIMPYMANGSLDKWLHDPSRHLDVKQRLDIMFDVASALHYLHHDQLWPIIHCDLKPSHVLLNQDMVAHISGFSNAMILSPIWKVTSEAYLVAGTPGCAAPELGRGIFSPKIDVYSFGIMLMEAFTRMRPTDKTLDMSLRDWVMKSLPHDIDKVMDSHLCTEKKYLRDSGCFCRLMDLAYRCSSELPCERVDIKEVLVELQHIRRSYLVIAPWDFCRNVDASSSSHQVLFNNSLEQQSFVPSRKAESLGIPRRSVAFLVKVLSSITAVLISCMFRELRWVRKSIRFPERTGNLEVSTLKKLTYNEIVRATRGFHKDYLIGSGSFSSVYYGVYDSKEVAIKVFNGSDTRELFSFHVEFNLMLNPLASPLRHKNLIRIICSVEEKNFLALIMPYMHYGSLEWLLHGPSSTSTAQRRLQESAFLKHFNLDMLQRLNIMVDVASALKYLHQDYVRTIVHCDLKPSNVLLNKNIVAHVSDFSIAQTLHPDETHTMGESRIFGTLGYVAPECGSQGIFSPKSDVYSFGIMLIEVFTGKRPSDDIFVGEMSLRSWVMESLSQDVSIVMDPLLLKTTYDKYLQAQKECFVYLMQLAYHCTMPSTRDRLDMYNVLLRLQRIKGMYLFKIL